MYIYILTLCAFQKMSCINIKLKDIHNLYNKKVVYLCVTPHYTIHEDSSDINTKKSYLLLKQGY